MDIPVIGQLNSTSSNKEKLFQTSESNNITNNNSSLPTVKTPANAPQEFPHEGFTTLNKTSDNLPLNLTQASTGILNKTNPNESNTTPKLSTGSTTLNHQPANITQTSSSVKPTDSEVDDLQNVPTKNPHHLDLLSTVSTNNKTAANNVDDSVVLIGSDENTEDAIKASSRYHEPHVALVQGQMAAILAGVFLCISFVGYVAMLSWRRYLE